MKPISKTELERISKRNDELMFFDDALSTVKREARTAIRFSTEPLTGALINLIEQVETVERIFENEDCLRP
jgi:hypothetical protein